jgi:hypothetical protein
MLFVLISSVSFWFTRSLTRQPASLPPAPAPEANRAPVAVPAPARLVQPSRASLRPAPSGDDVVLPELERRALDDARAAALRSLVVKAIGERVFGAPPCQSAREPGSLLRLELDVVSAAGLVTFQPRGFSVAAGAPLSPATMACIESRLSPRVQITWPPPPPGSAQPARLEFEGESVVEVAVGRPLT